MEKEIPTANKETSRLKINSPQSNSSTFSQKLLSFIVPRVIRLDEKSPFALRLTRLILPIVSLYILVGTFYDPGWWYEFFFEWKILNTETWGEGFSHLIEHFSIPALIVIGCVICVYLWLGPSGKLKFRRGWPLWKGNWYSKRGFYLQVFLLVLAVIGIARVKSTVEDQKRLLASIRQSTTTDNSPLSQPTSFIFISKNDVNSLYGQYEPDLIPISVIEEIKSSTELKAGINIQDYLKTEAGQILLKSRLAEYRQSPKNDERKLKDLLKYLFDKNMVKRYASLQSDSEEINKMDDAINLLKEKYNLSLDPKQLAVVRDRILSQEIHRLETELRSLHGLVFVEGDWSVETQQDTYLLKRPFVENVTDPPICETKLRKSDVSHQHQEIIEGLKGEKMRLRVFGNVITGMSGNSRMVRVNPIATF